jgi:hypothetical protein
MDKASMCGSAVRQFPLFMAMAAMHDRLWANAVNREKFL